MSYINERLVVAAINSHVCANEQEAGVLRDLLVSPDRVTREKGYKIVNAKLVDVSNAIHFGRVSDSAKGYIPDESQIHHKSFDGLWNPKILRAATFDLLSTMLNLDMKWTQFFQMVPAFGAGEIDTQTLTNLVVHKEYLPGAKIDVGPIAGLSETKLKERRFAGGTNFLQRWLTTNGLITINNILTRHQIAELVKKATVAYSALADTSGVTVEAFSGSIIHTVNEGVNSMVNAMLAATAGAYSVTDDSQFLLLSNSGNKEQIEAQFRTISGTDGNNPLVEFNVGRVYTRNTGVARDLGLGGANRAMLIFPGVANIWADFQAMKIGQEEDISSDSLKIIAQEYYNMQVVAIQKRVITLS